MGKGAEGRCCVVQFELLHRNFSGRTGEKRELPLSRNHSRFEEEASPSQVNLQLTGGLSFGVELNPPHTHTHPDTGSHDQSLWTVRCSHRRVGGVLCRRTVPSFVECLGLCAKDTYLLMYV